MTAHKLHKRAFFLKKVCGSDRLSKKPRCPKKKKKKGLTTTTLKQEKGTKRHKIEKSRKQIRTDRNEVTDKRDRKDEGRV